MTSHLSREQVDVMIHNLLAGEPGRDVNISRQLLEHDAAKACWKERP